jgi:hypothetical protein
MPPAGFEPTIPATAWPKTHALARAATGIDTLSTVSEEKAKGSQNMYKTTVKKRGKEFNIYSLHERTSKEG